MRRGMATAMIYLDHNSTTPVHPEVLAAMLPWLGEAYGNPSSVRYQLGRDARRAVETARTQVARLLACDPEEVIFTSGGSEANTQAILGSGPGGDGHPRIVTSRIEHPSVLHACRWARREGAELTELTVSSRGVIEPAALEQALAEDETTTLVSLMWVNNETGVVQPVAELSRLARANGALFHTDAAQAAGKVEIDLRELPVDLLSLTGHKIRAPKGVGALYVRRGTPLVPRIFGGEQERHLRAGTESVPLVVGLGKACEIAMSERASRVERLKALRDRLEQGLLASCPGATVHGGEAPRVTNTTSVGWADVHSDDLLEALDQNGICASSGSACTTLQKDPSHVLLSMGVDRDLARGTLRFSLGEETSAEEIDFVVRIVADTLAHLREEG